MRRAPVWAAVQMSSQGDLGENLAAALRGVHEAADRGAGVVLLPENFAFMGDEEQKRNIAEALEGDGPIASALRGVARERRLTVIAGGMPERSADPARPFNTCAAFGPDGRLLARYRKVHLFDVDLADGTSYRESASTSAGDDPVTMSIDAVGVGLSVCYDLRFPELYRALSLAGVEVARGATGAGAGEHATPPKRARTLAPRTTCGHRTRAAATPTKARTRIS